MLPAGYPAGQHPPPHPPPPSRSPAPPPVPPPPAEAYYNPNVYSPPPTRPPRPPPPPPLPLPQSPSAFGFDPYSVPFIPPAPPPLPPKLALAAEATRNRPPSPPTLPAYTPEPTPVAADAKVGNPDGFPADSDESEEALLARVLAESAADAATAQHDEDEALRRAIEESLSSASASSSSLPTPVDDNGWQAYDPTAFERSETPRPQRQATSSTVSDSVMSADSNDDWQAYDPRLFDFPRSVNDDLRSISEVSVLSHESDERERLDDERRMVEEMLREEEHLERERAEQIARDEELSLKLLEEEGLTLIQPDSNPFQTLMEDDDERMERLARDVEAAFRRKLLAAGEFVPSHLNGEEMTLPRYVADESSASPTAAGPVPLPSSSPYAESSQLPYLSPTPPSGPSFPQPHPYPQPNERPPLRHHPASVPVHPEERPHLRPHAASVPAPPVQRPLSAVAPRPSPTASVPASRPLSAAPQLPSQAQPAPPPRPTLVLTPRQAEKAPAVPHGGGFSPVLAGATTSPVLDKAERERIQMAAHVEQPTKDVSYLDAGLEDGVMSHISYGFLQPRMTYRLPPPPDQIPDLISLACFPSPAFHMQAPSWRAMLRALASMSDTRLEATPRALQRLGTAKLRAVVQFVKEPLGDSAWRTVLYLSIDNPVPRNTPQAWRYTNNDTTRLPYSFPTPPPGPHTTPLVNTPDTPIYAFPAPHPELPLRMSTVMRFLTDKMADARAAMRDSSSSARRLAKLVDSYYPEPREPRVREPGERRAALLNLLLLRKAKRRATGPENEETYDLVTPYRMDWG